MLHLGDTHRRLPTIGLHQLVWIIECSAMPCCDNLDPGFSSQVEDRCISFFRIWVGVPFEDEMGDVPCFEQLGQNGLRGFSDDEELGVAVQLCNGCR